ncbi:ImmA/IrrE family metallo-endopeptidase [Bacillus aquiflavi]|uniref:ImmA/IrrE family metallo-endopeptidase n=1 Tax=Bacillus aquiflavi TaxID=2672567 RepID=A0A6B3W6T4_9BACI|nr:ImmA/IrrE family metallo-endopeptidase [Bacillus aquiflavi]NEY83114.1 ImmA/IrrE family metallo-endopeptidase [Bacillus aquiflavi]
MGDVLGYYNSYKRIHFIHINNSISDSLQKFVCAHELGHAILHHDANTPFLKKNTFYSTEKIEAEANAFAVELLIPDEVVYEYKDTSVTINEVAEIYGVPKEVSHLKLINM